LPELPEVETIKNELSSQVVERGITDVDLFWEKQVRRPSAEEFRSRIVGQRIKGLGRRGKYLLFHLESGEILVIHLKMTGSLLVKPTSERPEKYVRSVINLDGGISIHFRDIRKFSGMWLVKDVDGVIKKMGLEPFDPAFTPRHLAGIIGSRSAPVKALLCDQTMIAGIGNMYADEALYEAGIHPMRPGSSLSKAEIKRLHGAIRKVLENGIGNKGASVNTYFLPDGIKGTAHSEFRVAHRRGEKCPLCGCEIERIVVRQRGTYFCPKCQKD
jgi:formamidopyrimidine-DNA glycosylase